MMNVKIQWLLCILVCAPGLGCRSRMDPSVDLLESELRWMEDQLYLLDDELDRKCSQLASSQRENATLRQELSKTAPSKTTSAGQSPSDRGTPSPAMPAPSATRPQPSASSRPPRESRPRADRPRPDRAGSPAASPPGETPPQGPSPSDSVPGHDVIPEVDELHPPNVELGTPAESVPDKAARVLRGTTSLISAGDDDEAVDAEVVTIELNSRLTGGYDFDGQPGHEGLLAVIEPRNTAGQYVPLPGNLSIVVIDPALSGPAARVARWDFTAAETVPLLRKSLLGKGIHLQLPWPHEPPIHDRLEVFARYITADGRKLQAQRTIQVDTLVALPRQSLTVTPMDPAMAIPPSAHGPSDSNPSPPPVASDTIPPPMDTIPSAELRTSQMPRLVLPASSAWQPYR